MNFMISLSINAKNPAGVFDRDCIEFIDQFEEYCHINNLVFSFFLLGIY